jgi:hypothetical protein
MEPWRAVNARHGGVEAQKGARMLVIAFSHHFAEDPNQGKNRIRIRIKIKKVGPEKK